MDWTHWHLILNHFPVVGIFFVVGLLLLGICRGSEELKRLSLQLAVGLFVFAMVVKTTGEQSAGRLLADASPGMKSLIAEHEDSADQSVTAAFLLFGFAAMGLYRSRKRRLIPSWATIGCVIFGLITLVMLGRSANLGGQIAHPEIRADGTME